MWRASVLIKPDHLERLDRLGASVSKQIELLYSYYGFTSEVSEQAHRPWHVAKQG